MSKGIYQEIQQVLVKFEMQTYSIAYNTTIWQVETIFIIQKFAFKMGKKLRHTTCCLLKSIRSET